MKKIQVKMIERYLLEHGFQKVHYFAGWQFFLKYAGNYVRVPVDKKWILVDEVDELFSNLNTRAHFKAWLGDFTEK